MDPFTHATHSPSAVTISPVMDALFFFFLLSDPMYLISGGGSVEGRGGGEGGTGDMVGS